jgi:hypothetical protein
MSGQSVFCSAKAQAAACPAQGWAGVGDSWILELAAQNNLPVDKLQ